MNYVIKFAEPGDKLDQASHSSFSFHFNFLKRDEFSPL